MAGTMLDIRNFRVRVVGINPKKKKKEYPAICHNINEPGWHYAK